MAYIGELMNECPAHLFDFKSTYAVLVLGDRWNPCGHILIPSCRFLSGTGGTDLQTQTGDNRVWFCRLS